MNGLPAAVSAVGDIDWTAPWLAPWRAAGEALAQRVRDGEPQPEALNLAARSLARFPVRFVPQSELPTGVAYEQHIFDTGRVPTRDGLHDFFNGLCWLQFPLTKTRLNELQAAQIAHSGIQPVRGPTRDSLTVFDENAALLQAPDALWDALVRKDWQRLFVELRPLWREAQLLLFGHALLEKLVSPRKAITAHVYRAQAASHLIADIDTWLAQDLTADKLAAKPFAHLPVMGVPGWCGANEDPAFYADASVFRLPQAGPAGSAGAALECP
ncbi:MAG: DUF3025 domain-containing protein [Rhodoferax sp.]|uniref:DUF3025 domain-containing protein n=1 Tax=Rhodoferax sp. TaxID=50421 RepID=UPI0014002080|nr:DUF3025 domain-containing protein [Rhodoferax sp.]NDP38598.1 DUF3025 domain-containing protein [Rhodoferax sp.]